MGKGGVNRLLLRREEVIEGVAVLLDGDARTRHVREVLGGGSIRVGVEGEFVHDEAEVEFVNGGVKIVIPEEGRRDGGEGRVVLVIAMQRPKAMGRILGVVASMGVEGMVICAADKVEKSYWDCKLFREEGIGEDEDGEEAEGMLPGRPRGEGKHPERDVEERVRSGRRVDNLEGVRRRLWEGLEQGGYDNVLPWVVVERTGIEAVLKDEKYGCGGREQWTKIVLHPGGESRVVRSVGKSGGDGRVMVAIGPEGGWTEEEVGKWEAGGFVRCGMGRRVLRSEVAVAVGLGLVYEGLREKGVEC